MKDTLIGALAKRDDIRKLTAVSNNAGSGDRGLGMNYAELSIDHALTKEPNTCRQTTPCRKDRQDDGVIHRGVSAEKTKLSRLL